MFRQVNSYTRKVHTDTVQPMTWEFRVGDTVENAETKQQFVIASLQEKDWHPSYPGEVVTGTPCYVKFEGWGACCVLVLKPTNPERICAV